MHDEQRKVAADWLNRKNLTPGWHSHPCQACNALVESLATLLAQREAAARLSALEEAARICERDGPEPRTWEDCAMEIRNLAEATR